jgi:hypothetical protein
MINQFEKILQDATNALQEELAPIFEEKHNFYFPSATEKRKNYLESMKIEKGQIIIKYTKKPKHFRKLPTHFQGNPIVYLKIKKE